MLFLLFACGQSYTDGLQALCDAPMAVETDGQGGLAAVAEHIDKTVTHPKARKLFEELAAAGSTEALHQEASKAGISPCPLIDPVAPPVREPIVLPGG